MRRFVLDTRLGLVLSLGALCGCGGSESTASEDTPSYVRDIQPLVATKCSGCHVEGGIAPFPLTTYEQVTAMKDAVRYAVSARIMPPWLAAEGCADYSGSRALTDAQIDTFVSWIDAGTPAGDAGDTPNAVEDTRRPLSRVDAELKLPVPYTPQIFPDDYRCFFLDWPGTETAYATGFGVAPGNESIVHHVISYVVPPEKIDIFQALDDADPGEGWTCFGGPGGMGPGNAAWLGAWVPGLSGEDLPDGTGIEIPAGAKIIAQIHYNLDSESPAPDQTSILLRTDASVEKKAAIMPFSDIKWITEGTMNIPAHATDVVHSATIDPTEFVSLATGNALPGGKPLTLYSTGLHLHTLGDRAMTRLDHADGSSECLLDVPRWDFHWQGNYTFATPKHVVPGDQLYLECQWDNPRDTEVNWGDKTSDEMCLGLFYFTE